MCLNSLVHVLTNGVNSIRLLMHIFFHQMGLANGRRHYQCPQCKNKSLFERFSIKSGIYLPHRDARWEMNEFSDFSGVHGEFKIAFAFDFNKNFVDVFNDSGYGLTLPIDRQHFWRDFHIDR